VNLQAADPIFILGILPRSGTNYLFDLLNLHPACARARDPVREDLFLDNSDHLVSFVAALQASWDPRWGKFSAALAEALQGSLGDGLLSFLWEHRDRRLLTKSPSVRHIDRFFTYFPHARLVILVRDGRSVTQSCMATFGWEFERGARNWAAAADEIRRFTSADHGVHEGRYLLARYEDLVRDLQGSLTPILRFLDLDEDAFDFQAATELPVRGSSAYFGPGHDSVHWDPVPRGTDFDPTERWRAWDRERHDRFEWIAGKQLRFFGYRGVVELAQEPYAVVTHRVRDWAWHSRVTIRRLTYHARVRVGGATRPLRERLGLVRIRP
jgi:protein-tyrosine sulfotransferase